MLIDEVIGAIERQEFILRVRRWTHCDGEVDFNNEEPNTITVSSLAEYPVAVLIHETLHYLYPEQSEAWVLEKEVALYAELQPCERRILERALKEAE